jgi:hypothetical protein
VWFPSVLIDAAGMPWSFRFLNIRFDRAEATDPNPG